MRRIKLEIAYDGTNYCGWQRQPDAPSVQETIEKVILKITGQASSVTGSGRTDAGVHALKQVAAFTTSGSLTPEVFYRALNGFLPHDIRVLSAEEVPMSFHPINDAVSKRYRYLIDDNRPPSPILQRMAWIYREPLDVAAIQSAAEWLLGEHDFACFQTQGSPRKTTVRTITDVLVDRVEMPLLNTRLIRIEVEANGFLYNMMRTIAGTLTMLSRTDANRMQAIIESKDRSQSGPTAPPHGLYMVEVKY
ncbi:tRNA pseudouridine synthase A [Planctomycetales bacterium]|nr:tRNA pseudouridine synthase A [Planctomycetales bacterium]